MSSTVFRARGFFFFFPSVLYNRKSIDLVLGVIFSARLGGFSFSKTHFGDCKARDDARFSGAQKEDRVCLQAWGRSPGSVSSSICFFLFVRLGLPGWGLRRPAGVLKVCEGWVSKCKGGEGRRSRFTSDYVVLACFAFSLPSVSRCNFVPG